MRGAFRLQQSFAAVAVARRILAGFATPGVLAAATSGVGVSIGVALGVGQPAAEVLRHADEALYAAKRQGKGRYIVWSGARCSEAS